MRRATIMTLAALVCVVAADAALAQNRQQQQPQGRPWEGEGSIEAIAPNGALRVSTKDGPYIVQTVPGKSKISFTGTAEHDFLKPKMGVKFHGEINEEGVLQGEISELEVFTPNGKNDVGLFPAGSGDDAKPVRDAAAGTYIIKGTVGSFKDDELTVVAAGKKITGKLASSAAVKVATSDMNFVQTGDSVKGKGIAYNAPQQQQGRQQQGRPPQQQQLQPGFQAAPQEPPKGLIAVEELTVTGSKPLMAPKKGK